MKYQCKDKHIFTIPARRTEFDFNRLPYAEAQGKEFIHPGDNSVTAKTEFSVCPICESEEIAEYIEPIQEIIGVKSVPLEEVDDWLLKGYKVRELYAKAATLVKLEEKKQ